MMRVMLVDDESNVLTALRRLLLHSPLAGGTAGEQWLELFTSPELALKRADEVPFDLVISDYRMPGMDGVHFLQAMRERHPGTARIILSGYADLAGLIRAINDAGIHRYMNKPWNNDELLLAIQQTLAYRELQIENQRLADQVRLQEGKLSRQELALKRLAEENPALAKVHWGADGSVIFDDC